MCGGDGTLLCEKEVISAGADASQMCLAYLAYGKDLDLEG